jgi:hypothetical protein
MLSSKEEVIYYKIKKEFLTQKEKQNKLKAQKIRK